MSDAGIEAASDDPGARKGDETLVEARMAALTSRWPDRFSEDELQAIREKVAGHIAMARSLHSAPLDPSVEPPPFVPYRGQSS